MSKNGDRTSRRKFLGYSGAALFSAGAAHAGEGDASVGPVSQDEEEPATQETPEVTMRTIAEAEKLAGVSYTERERKQILRGLDGQIQGRQRLRQVNLENGLAPAMDFDPRLPAVRDDMIRNEFIRSTDDPRPLPTNETDIAYAPLTRLSRWIESRQLSSVDLTSIYLDRLKKHDPKLECVVTITEDRAIAQAKRADEEIRAGRYRGPLHGIPWGAKDLLDTKGVKTTWGAMPYRDRVAQDDAVVVKRLEEAGAVLVAKTTLGALAYGDIWFGGRTNNPWNTNQGSSGSSAGSAAATAAGLVGFSIGTETLGSIVSPCMRCGTTGLRPTFGRVARTGAMALCWSLDKIGPICRTVEDCALVLHAINGADAGDSSSLDVPLQFNAAMNIKGLRIGYDPAWFEGRRVSEVDQAALESIRRLGVEPVEVTLPDLPYGSLMSILNAEAAAAFEELTLSNRDDELKWQEDRAWPNSFRQTRFISAIDFVQATRFRRMVMQVMHDLFEEHRLDAMFGPSYAGSMLMITNSTGHPSITLRAGFRSNDRPHGVTVWGRPFHEGTICAIGMALEKALNVWDRRPAEFS